MTYSITSEVVTPPMGIISPESFEMGSTMPRGAAEAVAKYMMTEHDFGTSGGNQRYARRVTLFWQPPQVTPARETLRDYGPTPEQLPS